MKKRQVLIPIVMFGFLLIGVAIFYFVYTNRYDISYELNAKIPVEKSKYHISGSWWGYNQKKLASIEDVTFSFTFDNSNLDNGNSSESNPLSCHFTKIVNGVSEIFDSGEANASCNVLSDPTRNKIYYIVNEPVGGPNLGGYAWTNQGKIVVYTYSYDRLLDTVSFEQKTILAEGTDDGRQRMGATINSQGQIMISYGAYDAYIHVYIFDPIQAEWNSYQTLSNPDQDFLMYNYAIIKDLDEFYILAIQDTAMNGQNYYQYVKFFGYVNGNWIEEMVVDYRDREEASQEPNLVEHTEFTLIDNRIHIITRSSALKEIRYFIWDQNELTEQDSSFINKHAYWIRIIQVDGDILYVYNLDGLFGPKLEIFSDKKQKIVFSQKNIVDNAYLYVHVKENETIQVLAICGKDKNYDTSNAYIYEIQAQ